MPWLRGLPHKLEHKRQTEAPKLKISLHCLWKNTIFFSDQNPKYYVLKRVFTIFAPQKTTKKVRFDRTSGFFKSQKTPIKRHRGPIKPKMMTVRNHKAKKALSLAPPGHCIFKRRGSTGGGLHNNKLVFFSIDQTKIFP